MYRHHTGFIGGLKEVRAKDMLERKPVKMFELAVKGMLPKNILAGALLDNLYVYAGSEHPHAAQQPKQIDLNLIK